jgi:hypothetical protein
LVDAFSIVFQGRNDQDDYHLLGSLYLLLGFTDLIIIDVVLFLGQVEFSHCSHAIL